MIVKLLTEHHLEFLSLKEGCRGSSESTDIKMPHCWKSYLIMTLMCQSGKTLHFCLKMELLFTICWLVFKHYMRLPVIQ